MRSLLYGPAIILKYYGWTIVGLISSCGDHAWTIVGLISSCGDHASNFINKIVARSGSSI
jgi:hypothetical protein